MKKTRIGLYKTTKPTRSRPNRRVWLLRWNDSNGRRLGEVIGEADVMNKREADAIRRERQGRMDNALTPIDRPTRMTLEDFQKHDRATIAGTVRGSTLIEHDLAWGHAIAALGARTSVDVLDWSHLGRIRSHLKDRSAATVHKTLRALRTSLGRAVRQKFIAANPFTDYAMPKLERPSVRVFTLAESSAMLAAASADVWWTAFLSLGFGSGLRLGEMLNLWWTDVDLAEGVVKVTPKQRTTFEAGGKTFHTWDWSAKAESSYRTVPGLPLAAVKALRRLRAKMANSPMVFLSLDRIAALQPRIEAGTLPAKLELINNLGKRFGVIQKRAAAKLAKSMPKDKGHTWADGSIHDMRKTWCTRLAANGVAMHELREIAGHSDISTTAGFYLKADASVGRKVRQALAAV